LEKTVKRQSLPETDSIEKLTRFWDSHDLTDFGDDLEEVGNPVFVRAGGSSVRIDLPEREAGRVKRIARSRGLDESTMLRQWILERIDEAFPEAESRRSNSQMGKRRIRRG
jgi:hypothetical protein